MAHEIAKLLLKHAGSFLERTEAVRSATSLGMPLNEVEDYLDWVASNPSRPLPALRCLAFCGQSNSLFSREKDGRSDGSNPAQEDQVKALLLRGV